MGGFFLYPSDYKLNNKVFSAFNLKGFGSHSTHRLGKFTLIHFEKQLFPLHNSIENQAIRLFATGTLIYKSKDYEDSLKCLADDLCKDKFSPEEINGNYFVIYEKQNKLFYITDPDCFYNVFYNEYNGTLSSSFIASTMSSNRKLTLNKEAITEVLTTGNLIGPDTFFNQISRLEPFTVLPPGYPAKIDTRYRISVPTEIFKNRKDTVIYQLDALGKVIVKYKELLNRCGTISGLTGGLDSRLLFFVLLKNGVNFTPYSTWRKIASLEFKCANELAAAANKRLKYVKYPDVLDLEENEYIAKVRDNFYFNDGIIRTNQIWLEEIKGKYYLKNILGKNKVDLSGVSGEQYRNSEYLIKKHYSLKNWIKYELIYYVSGSSLNRENALQLIVKNISQKIIKHLDLDSEKQISFADIKRFYNTIYSSANRTIRNSIENQAAFFISPYTEYELTRKSYLAIPYLGIGLEFQKEMICLLAPEYNDIITDYGFKLGHNIPFQYKAVPYAKKYLGLYMYHELYNKLSKGKQDSFYSLLINKFNFIKNQIATVKELNLPIDYNIIMNNSLVQPLLLETGFFIEEMNDYIKYD